MLARNNQQHPLNILNIQLVVNFITFTGHIARWRSLMATAKRHNSATRPKQTNTAAIVRVGGALTVVPMFHRCLRPTPESTAARAERPPVINYIPFYVSINYRAF